MGKFDGKHLTGLIGPVVSRRGRNGMTILQTAPRKFKQTKATKQAANLFGLGSTLAKAIRKDLNMLIRSHYDGDMINRFNKPVKEVIRQCYNPETQKFNFSEDSFSRLTGAEFNIRSPLINSLWVRPEVHLDGNTLKINLPEITTDEQLKFPLRANVCELKIAVTLIAPEPGLRTYPLQQSITISKTQETVPAQEFVFEVPDGCLCVAGIGLNYFSLQDNIKTVINGPAFNPAGVCGAVISPGAFVLPPPEVVPNGKKASVWSDIHKLKLPRN
ncbi:hypothetical protein [Pedobacter africanus]|uniref:Uncharacterized protein n=1 Tax=Pedobacter africanus TaxID=151894 RepID=A0A1W2DZ99_9SPHI|nr:hypothetical protein [Pedobacter africanus]SMD02412.1 hypothetical protein SAMN04488524_4259 [Pedobacter africanus]